MEEFYQVPFGKFERYCPCGTPEEIAASLQPYVEAGCRSFNLIPVADSEQAAIEAADAVRDLLARGADMMTGRVAIVTGGTRGIGAAISELLAADGTHVAAVYAGRHDAARELAGRLAAAGGSVSVHPGDIADPEFCRGLVAELVAGGDASTTWSATPGC